MLMSNNPRSKKTLPARWKGLQVDARLLAAADVRCLEAFWAL